MVGKTLFDRIVTNTHNYLSPNINIICGRSGEVVSKQDHIKFCMFVYRFKAGNEIVVDRNSERS